MARAAKEVMGKCKVYSMHEEGCDFAGEFAYTGKTTRTLEERMVEHRGDAIAGNTGKVHQYTREKDPSYFTMTLLEEFEETIEGEGAFQELWWSMWLRTGLNTNTRGLVTLLGKKKYQEKYREANKERLGAKRREHHINNKERQNAASREYHTANREFRNAERKKNHAASRESRNAKKRERIDFPCGRPYTRGSKTRHFDRWHSPPK